MNTKSFTQRRLEQLHKNPDYEITAYITGVRDVNNAGWIHWSVSIEGEDNLICAAGILERAAEVLRDK